MTTTYQEPNALGRATLQPSRAKSVVRTAIHLLSYYFILKRRRAAQTRVAGFRLIAAIAFRPFGAEQFVDLFRAF